MSGLLQLAAQQTHGWWRSRAFRHAKLNQYRSSILANDRHQPLDFLSTAVDIDDTYVQTQYVVDGVRRDLYSGVRDASRAVVLGAAGAGKSIFFRYWVVRWARRPQDFHRLPVVVDLHLYRSRPELGSIEQLVLDKLARRDCRETLAALEHALQSGRLSLLLDGLDEVVDSHRDPLIAELRGFAQRYPTTQIVVTCRDAVYDGRLQPVFENQMHISGFDDAGMRRFLGQWFRFRRHDGRQVQPSTDESIRGNIRERVEQVMAELHASPALYQLARTPLLLTMMAYLQVDDPGAGPLLTNSRADFYKLAIEHMLRRDVTMGRTGGIARFRAAHKSVALQRIALAAQKVTASGARAIDEHEVIEQIAAVLERLKMADSPRAMLDEIVERSELLARIDEQNLLYQFPHMTLQEYLAARALADAPAELLARYRENRGRWRETLKLWCGAIDRDCGDVVQSVFSGTPDHPATYQDRLLALECIPEAQEIRDEVVNTIVGYFHGLGVTNDGTIDDLRIAALGAIAADPRPWGVDTYRYLTATAWDGTPLERVAAMQALAATRQPRAIELLRSLAHDTAVEADARAALRSVGEQAIPHLLARAVEGHEQDVHDLAQIGTAGAAYALGEIVWTDGPAAPVAAWHLARMFRDRSIEDELRRTPPPKGTTPGLPWAWEPFAEASAEEFSALAGRISYLLAEEHVEPVTGEEAIDPRLGLAAVIARGPARRALTYDKMDDGSRQQVLDSISATVFRRGRLFRQRKRLSSLLDAAIDSATTDLIAEDLQTLLRLCRLDPIDRHLIRAFGHLHGAMVLLVLYVRRRTHATIKDWRTVLDRPEEPRLLRRIYMSIGLGAASAALATGIVRWTGELFGWWPWGPSWLAFATLFVLALGISGILVFMRRLELQIERLFDDNSVDSETGRREFLRWTGCLLSPMLALGVTLLVYAAASLADVVGWTASLGVIAGLCAANLLLRHVYLSRKRKFDNPLRDLLHEMRRSS
ncbi:NACHT domain-containing protein [Catellatospora chokoriensis]|uniref:NACHT domain-containing protein n=1 Tax=Catellatospora chokoriensis TaxID=310353 RepID=UPI00177EDF9F|nr:NACHT domain-containing protein [Catellatospora chokoriensis]